MPQRTILATYHDLGEPRYMPVRERFEDLYFALEVLEELGREIVSLYGLYCDLNMGFLYYIRIQGQGRRLRKSTIRTS